MNNVHLWHDNTNYLEEDEMDAIKFASEYHTLRGEIYTQLREPGIDRSDVMSASHQLASEELAKKYHLTPEEVRRRVYDYNVIREQARANGTPIKNGKIVRTSRKSNQRAATVEIQAPSTADAQPEQVQSEQGSLVQPQQQGKLPICSITVLGKPKSNKTLGIYDWLEYNLREIEVGETVQIDFVSNAEASDFSAATIARRLGWKYFSSTKDNSLYITRIG